MTGIAVITVATVRHGAEGATGVANIDGVIDVPGVMGADGPAVLTSGVMDGVLTAVCAAVFTGVIREWGEALSVRS